MAAPANAQDADLGKKIFESKGNCASCHGKDARGSGLAPDLTDSLWLHVDGSKEQIAQLVRTGVPKPKRYPAPMPALGGAKLSDAEVTAVADYVTSRSRGSRVSMKSDGDRRRGCPHHRSGH